MSSTTLLALALAFPPAAPLVPPDAVASLDSLTAFAERAPRRPLAWGLMWNPYRDAGREHTSLFLISADSTVWLQGSTGETLLLDPYVVMNVGETAGDRTGYAVLARNANFLGYGYEDDHIYVTFRQGTGTYTAIAFLTALVCSIGGLVVWLVRRLRAERRQRVMLAESHRRLVEAREEERLRIAQDIHDGPVQDLNTVNLRLAGVRAREARTAASRPPEDTATVTDVAELQTEVVGIARELRGISEALRPPTLGPFGLAAALRVHADRFAQHYPSVRVRLALDDDGQVIPEDVRLVLFRIAQEALTNAAKHGAPGTVHVALQVRPAAVTLTVSDDGGGFSTGRSHEAYAQAGHFGLVGMAERAESIGARLSVESLPESGTTVHVEVSRTGPRWRVRAAAPSAAVL